MRHHKVWKEPKDVILNICLCYNNLHSVTITIIYLTFFYPWPDVFQATNNTKKKENQSQ